MKFLILLILLPVLLASLQGCTSMSVTITNPDDGETCKASYTSFFRTLENPAGSACGLTASAGKAGSDSQLASALTSALVRGIGVAP